MDLDTRLFFAALMVQRQNYVEAREHINFILDKDWTHSNANILFSLIYKQENWP